MSEFTFCVPCLFGLEGLVGDELKRLDMENVRVENGRVLFDGGVDALAAANLRMRMGERVLLRLGSFPARSFEELFQGVKALPLEDFIPSSTAFVSLFLIEFGIFALCFLMSIPQISSRVLGISTRILAYFVSSSRCRPNQLPQTIKRSFR